MAILGLVIGPHLLGVFSVSKIQLGMPAGPALQRETTNTCESSITCRVHNKALHHQLHGQKQMLQKKKIYQVIHAVDIDNVDISCKYGYFMMLALTVMLFPLFPSPRVLLVTQVNGLRGGEL